MAHVTERHGRRSAGVARGLTRWVPEEASAFLRHLGRPWQPIPGPHEAVLAGARHSASLARCPNQCGHAHDHRVPTGARSRQCQRGPRASSSSPRKRYTSRRPASPHRPHRYRGVVASAMRTARRVPVDDRQTGPPGHRSPSCSSLGSFKSQSRLPTAGGDQLTARRRRRTAAAAAPASITTTRTITAVVTEPPGAVSDSAPGRAGRNRSRLDS